jgi:hypothetical protein
MAAMAVNKRKSPEKGGNVMLGGTSNCELSDLLKVI